MNQGCVDVFLEKKNKKRKEQGKTEQEDKKGGKGGIWGKQDHPKLRRKQAEKWKRY
jgi:hypothetical protein